MTNFEFEVVAVEIKKSGWFGNKSKLALSRQKKQRELFREDLGNEINLDLLFIPAGSFWMGAPEKELNSNNNERPQHQVNLQAFLMGRYPITQAQWQIVAGWEAIDTELNPDPSAFKDDYKSITRWSRPVENISWWDAIEFCARLSKRTKREYRLPSEAEWEYAARAGTNTPFHFGETISTELANYRGIDWHSQNRIALGHYGRGLKGIFREETTPVGYFKAANRFGLDDLHGNVWEWCQDDWHHNYQNAPDDGRPWLLEQSNNKVIRGGSGGVNPSSCRAAYRSYNSPSGRFNDIGLRVVSVVSSR